MTGLSLFLSERRVDAVCEYSSVEQYGIDFAYACKRFSAQCDTGGLDFEPPIAVQPLGGKTDDEVHSVSWYGCDVEWCHSRGRGRRLSDSEDADGGGYSKDARYSEDAKGGCYSTDADGSGSADCASDASYGDSSGSTDG
jgi:hypothetical protein